jgi:carbonic anhydrase
MSGKNLCESGTFQSPINIDTQSPKQKIIPCQGMCDLMIHYRTSKCNLINTGSEILVDYDAGSYITYKNQIYELNQLSFTLPASHKLDNRNFTGEIQLHHHSPDTGAILIIAVFFTINDVMSLSNSFLSVFENELPKSKGGTKVINTSSEWNAYNILPEIKSFYTYMGSLPRSPCTQDVTWIIFDNSVNCSNIFYDRLKALYPGNARSIQNVNNRPIYYNVNSSEKNRRNYGENIRCYTEKEFRKECGKLMGQPNRFMSLKQTQILIIIATITIVCFFFLFVMFLESKGFFKWAKCQIMNYINKTDVVCSKLLTTPTP